MPAGSYSPEASARVYAAVLARAERVLRAGHSVVLDAVFAREDERRRPRRWRSRSACRSRVSGSMSRRRWRRRAWRAARPTHRTPRRRSSSASSATTWDGSPGSGVMVLRLVGRRRPRDGRSNFRYFRYFRRSISVRRALLFSTGRTRQSFPQFPQFPLVIRQSASGPPAQDWATAAGMVAGLANMRRDRLAAARRCSSVCREAKVT